jgi:uncharacterized protein YcbX
VGPVGVVSLHRYPVKSILGEDLDALDVDERGVVGDRWWSVRTAAGKIGSGKNTNRFAAVPGLLALRARTDGDRVRVALPDGGEYDVEDPSLPDVLSKRLGQPVTLARESDVMHFDDGPVSLLGRASLEALAAHRGEPVAAVRFRANVLLDTTSPFVEDEWVGREVAIGTALLRVTMRSPRCVMVDMATADLPEQHGNLLALGALSEACIGVIAEVVRPGRMTVGDPVECNEIQHSTHPERRIPSHSTGAGRGQ